MLRLFTEQNVSEVQLLLLLLYAIYILLNYKRKFDVTLTIARKVIISKIAGLTVRLGGILRGI